jgi:hypothetical protein
MAIRKGPADDGSGVFVIGSVSGPVPFSHQLRESATSGVSKQIAIFST